MMMKKLTISLFLFLAGFCSNSLFGQAKKPTLMILPSDNWCNQRYFITEYENQGTIVKVPDYKLAFQEDVEIGLVITKIGSLMAERGFPLKDAEQELKNTELSNAETSVTTSKTSGSSIAESPLDKLKNRAKADILIQVWWKVNKSEKGKSVTFSLEAFDTYTSKQIASAGGTGKPSKTDAVPVLLESAVNENIGTFLSQLQQHFNDMFENGREIVLSLKRWENCNIHFNDVIEGKELANIIDDWMRNNCYKGIYSTIESTDDNIRFEQVRIPIYDKNNKPIDARQFAIGLENLLQNVLNLKVKLITRGLGEAILIIGEK